MRGSCSKFRPGGRTRFGPAQLTGLARSENIGSIRTAEPENCRRKLEWPIKVTAKSPGATGGGGGGCELFAAGAMQGLGRRRKIQRRRPPKDGLKAPSRLRNF